jgi:hypothetical protein
MRLTLKVADFHRPASARDPLGPGRNRLGHGLEMVGRRNPGDALSGLQIVVAVSSHRNSMAGESV